MESEKTYAISLISKYRSALMGIASICICLCHFSNCLRAHNIPVTHFALILEHLHSGVDIFLFVSGFGLYYSYSNGKCGFAFYKKRIIKIIPLYLLVTGITYLLFDSFISGRGVFFAIQRLLFIPWFTEGSTKCWYILTILVFYMLFPLIYQFVSVKRSSLLFLFFCILYWALTYLLDDYSDHYRLYKFRQGIERFPIFVFGALCARYSKEGKHIKKELAYLMILIGLSNIILQYVFKSYGIWIRNVHFGYWGTSCLLGISIIILFCLLFENMQSKVTHVFIENLERIGKSSLEIYLLHSSILTLLNNPFTYLSYFGVAVVLVIMGGIVLHSIVSRVHLITKIAR